MAKAQITLVVNADDFGLSEGINKAIADGFDCGILRSASLMACGSALDDAVRTAQERPGLGVGVHLTLVDERPILSADKLAGLVRAENMLPASYAAFARLYCLKRFGTLHVRDECRAQIEKVLSSGVRPTHLDSHQHIHILPGIIDVVIDLAREFDIGSVRLPLESGGLGPSFFTPRGAQLQALALLCKFARLKLRSARLRHADWFWGLGVSGAMTEPMLMDTLARLRPGVNEIMCHPGFSNTATSARYQWGYMWDEEAAALTSDAVISRVAANALRLTSFRRI